jgi:hypothetical protein
MIVVVGIVAYFEFPGEPIENYDRGIERGGEAVRNQPDREYHVCFETEEGWAVVDVWKSEEAFARFGEFLALEPDRRPKVYRVHNVM